MQPAVAVLLMLAMAADMFFAARPLEAAVVTVEPGYALSKLVDSLVPLHPSKSIRKARNPLSVHVDSSIWISADFAGFPVRKLGIPHRLRISSAPRVRSQFCRQQAIDLVLKQLFKQTARPPLCPAAFRRGCCPTGHASISTVDRVRKCFRSDGH